MTLLLLPLLILLAAVPVATSQEASNATAATATTVAAYDCIDPSNRANTARVRRGELTTVCLYVGPGGDWNDDTQYKRFSVNLVADEFSSYEIPGSFQAIAGGKSGFNSDAVHIFAMSQSSLSFLRRYIDKPASAGRIYPYLTAIIDVQDGIVRGIAWDDACVFCEKAQCLANTYNFDGSPATQEQIRQPVNGCYLTNQECAGFALDGSGACNLRLHVVWTGTDADGKVLLSSDSRFSMFPPNRIQENVRGRYENMVKGLEDLKAKFGGRLGTVLETLMDLLVPGPTSHASLSASPVSVAPAFRIQSFAISENSRRAVSGLSEFDPGGFFTGANSSSRTTSNTAMRSERGKTSKMKLSNLIPLFDAGFTVPFVESS
ncbi:hypothetical protein ACHAWF_016008 [Thalassiosira exigua]